MKDLSEKTLLKTITYGYGSSGWTDRLTSYDGESIVYDSMGNPTTYRGKELGWKRRQLRSLELEDGTKLTYKYDADGLRTKKTVGSESYDYYDAELEFYHLNIRNYAPELKELIRDIYVLIGWKLRIGIEILEEIKERI